MIQDILTPAQIFRALVLMTLSVFGIGLGIGLMYPLISVVLEARGYSSWMIGLNHAMNAVAILAVGPFIPWIIKRFGAVRVVVAGIFTIAALLTVLPMSDDIVFWFVMRFIIGMVFAGPWIGSETLVNLLAPEKSRGRWLAAFFMVLCLGFAIGPQIIEFVGTEGPLPFYVASVLLVVSALPVLWCPLIEIGEESDAKPSAWLRTFKLAPLAMLGGFYTGFTDAAALGLLPVYGLKQGLSESDSVSLLTMYLVGQTVLIPLLGWLMDYMRTPPMYRLIALVATGAAAGVAASIHLPWALAVCVFLWGGVNGAAYSVALTNLGRIFAPAQLAAANTTFVIFFNIGSAAGPFVVGRAMDASPAYGFSISLALPAVLLGALTFFVSSRPLGQASDEAQPEKKGQEKMEPGKTES